MSFPRSLDEYESSELRAEIERRRQAFDDEKCDYCGRDWGNEPACKFPDRHRSAHSKSQNAPTTGSDKT